MRKILLIGRSEAGKTTLTQALKGEQITYQKTQYVNYESVLTIVLGGLFGNLSERYEVEDLDVKKAKQLLTALGLKNRISYPYDMLSKGQRQKVLIARALMTKPELLILDEPCTGLDVVAREHFLNTVEEITKEMNTSLVYVTHHPDEILPIFNKAMLMKNGQIHSQGDLHDMFTDENMSSFFDHETKVEWVKDKMQFRIADGLKLDKNIWNMNNEKTHPQFLHLYLCFFSKFVS